MKNNKKEKLKEKQAVECLASARRLLLEKKLEESFSLLTQAYEMGYEYDTLPILGDLFLASHAYDFSYYAFAYHKVLGGLGSSTADAANSPHHAAADLSMLMAYSSMLGYTQSFVPFYCKYSSSFSGIRWFPKDKKKSKFLVSAYEEQICQILDNSSYELSERRSAAFDPSETEEGEEGDLTFVSAGDRRELDSLLAASEAMAHHDVDKVVLYASKVTNKNAERWREAQELIVRAAFLDENYALASKTARRFVKELGVASVEVMHASIASKTAIHEGQTFDYPTTYNTFVHELVVLGMMKEYAALAQAVMYLIEEDYNGFYYVAERIAKDFPLFLEGRYYAAVALIMQGETKAATKAMLWYKRHSFFDKRHLVLQFFLAYQPTNDQIAEYLIGLNPFALWQKAVEQYAAVGLGEDNEDDLLSILNGETDERPKLGMMTHLETMLQAGMADVFYMMANNVYDAKHRAYWREEFLRPNLRTMMPDASKRTVLQMLMETQRKTVETYPYVSYGGGGFLQVDLAFLDEFPHVKKWGKKLFAAMYSFLTVCYKFDEPKHCETVMQFMMAVEETRLQQENRKRAHLYDDTTLFATSIYFFIRLVYEQGASSEHLPMWITTLKTMNLDQNTLRQSILHHAKTWQGGLKEFYMEAIDDFLYDE